MARGWESKSIESQVEAAEERKAASIQQKLTEAQTQLQKERESIELSRERILREMEAARHPRHREQLAAALTFLEEQLSKLS